MGEWPEDPKLSLDAAERERPVEPWVVLYVQLRKEVKALTERVADLERRIEAKEDYERDQRERA